MWMPIYARSLLWNRSKRRAEKAEADRVKAQKQLSDRVGQLAHGLGREKERFAREMKVAATLEGEKGMFVGHTERLTTVVVLGLVTGPRRTHVHTSRCHMYLQNCSILYPRAPTSGSMENNVST